jgi:segregation and condensation protein A
MLKEITEDLETLDSIRCFFAILFLARDQKIGLEQNDDDIMITLIENVHKDEKKHGKN